MPRMAFLLRARPALSFALFTLVACGDSTSEVGGSGGSGGEAGAPANGTGGMGGTPVEAGGGAGGAPTGGMGGAGGSCPTSLPIIDEVPMLLSETGLYADIATDTVA